METYIYLLNGARIIGSVFSTYSDGAKAAAITRKENEREKWERRNKG